MRRFVRAAGQLRTDTENQLGVTEPNTVAGGKPGSFDGPAVQKRLVSATSSQIDQNELIIGRPLDQSMVAVHRNMVQCDVVITVPADPQKFAGKSNRHRWLADLDPSFPAQGRNVD